MKYAQEINASYSFTWPHLSPPLKGNVSSRLSLVKLKNLSLLLLAKKQIYMVPITFILRMALVETIREIWNIQEFDNSTRPNVLDVVEMAFPKDMYAFF